MVDSRLVDDLRGTGDVDLPDHTDRSQAIRSEDLEGHRVNAAVVARGGRPVR
jgi:hypothetical protein